MLFWFHIDRTHESYSPMRLNAFQEHAKNLPNHNLSVWLNLDGTEALVKVNTDGTYNPDWESAPFVIRKYTESEIDMEDRRTLSQSSEWLRPEGWTGQEQDNVNV